MISFSLDVESDEAIDPTYFVISLNKEWCSWLEKKHPNIAPVLALKKIVIAELDKFATGGGSMNPTDCKLCGQPCFNDKGRPIGEVLIYQFIDGRMVLAVEPRMGYNLLNIHAKCIEQLSERV